MSRQPTQRFWRSSALPFAESRSANDSAACYAPHSHATLSIGAVDGGHSVFRREGSQQRLNRGDVVLIPAGEVHSCNPKEDGRWSYQMLYLDPAWVDSVVGEMGALDAVVLNRLPEDVSPQRIHARLSCLNEKLFGVAEDENKAEALVLFVGDLFGAGNARRFAAEAKPDVARLTRVKEMISARCTELLTLADLAREAQMSCYHFVRLFRRQVGMTPHAWQLDQRIVQARRLLDQDLPLADIALQLGFADQSHFQRAFKQRVAATPGEYQNALRSRNFVQY